MWILFKQNYGYILHFLKLKVPAGKALTHTCNCMLVTFLHDQDSANEVEDFESGDDVDGSPGRATIKAKWTKVFWIIIIAIQIIHPCQKKK